MMEFMFGLYNSSGNSTTIQQLIIENGGPLSIDEIFGFFGARSQNIENAYIPGFELSIVGQGSIGDVDVTTLCGYTYINPTSIDPDSSYLSTFSNPDLKTLKYRNLKGA